MLSFQNLSFYSKFPHISAKSELAAKEAQTVIAEQGIAEMKKLFPFCGRVVDDFVNTDDC